jgi:Mg2+ and Co2+ transporter CorA
MNVKVPGEGEEQWFYVISVGIVCGVLMMYMYAKKKQLL